MRNYAVVFAVVAVAALAVPATAESPIVGDSGGGESVHSEIPAPFTVLEWVEDLGGGTYRYSFEFANTDTQNIWHFVMWTPFGLVSGPTPFDQKPGWSNDLLPIDGVHPAYDARNLDPSITWAMDTYPPDWYPLPTSDPIAPGDCVSGFAFTANTLHTAPLWFGYETNESGWTQTNGTGLLRGIGTTSYVPEPGTLLLLSTGGMALLGAVRRRRKAG